MKKPGYEFEVKSKRPEGSNVYSFVSADGVTPKKGFRDSEILIADNLRLSDEDLLVVQSGYGFLGTVAAPQTDGEVLMCDTSDRAIQLSNINLERNNVKNAKALRTSFYSELDGSFDKAVYAPKSYEPVKLVKNRISNIVGLLRPEAELLIAGSRNSGIKRYKDYLEGLEGSVEKIGKNGGQKLYKYTEEIDERPENLEIEKGFTATVGGVELGFKTCEGLFSSGKLDDGSRLLMENLELSGREQVLDVGCGYGALGIYAAKKFDAEVSLTDDSALAVHYARKNLERNGVERFHLENRDCIDGFEEEKFDAVVSNPPTHQGKSVTDEIFQESFNRLRNGGKMILVYNKNMRFQQELEDIFKDTEVLDEKDNYRVLKALK
ncbi:MAG: methyltransferase [Candidatus Nanohalobium sp.]